MLSLETVLPERIPVSVVERFFVTRGYIPPDQPLKNSILPSIMQSLIINFGSDPQYAYFPNGEILVCQGDQIMGQFTARIEDSLQGKLEYIGIQFSPTGLYRLLQVPMDQFSNRIRALKDHIDWHDALRNDLESAEETSDHIAVLEKHVGEHLLVEESELLKAIEQAADLIRQSNGSMPLAETCRKVGLSVRTLQRYFPEFVGVSPKAFARIARFNAVTRLIEQEKPLNWQEIWAETGYFDAAHFVNDFKAITGMTPSSYYKGKTYYERFFYGT